jgi:hypothetical protein
MQLNIRISEGTRRQLDMLTEHYGESEGKVISRLIDREAMRLRRSDMQQETIYRVPEAPEYWGPDCTEEWGQELAEAMAQALREFAKAQAIEVQIETVPEVHSRSHRSEGDPDTIATLDAERERLFSDGSWEWARETRAYGDWK